MGGQTGGMSSGAKPRVIRFATSVLGAWLITWATAAGTQGAAMSYLTPEQCAGRLKALAGDHPGQFKSEQLAKSASGKAIWLAAVTLGTEPVPTNTPAILAVAGIEGNDLAGTAILTRWLGELATNHTGFSNAAPAIIYVAPCMNPDAAAAFFGEPKREAQGDTSPVDEDHDGLVDEDGPEDLNGDGLITSMRIRDPEGQYIPDPLEPGLLIKADASKGEAGQWRLYSEGVDNDKDEEWNEDPPGGVNLNRNFPCNYKYFGPMAGTHPLSQPAARALADFVIAHPNIAMVFVYGSTDNLSRTPKAEAPKRPATALHEGDAPIYKELGKTWRDTLGLKKELESASAPGTFADWMYFHRGRLALAAKPWSPALQVALTKPAKPAAKTNDTTAADAKPKSDPPDKPDGKPDASRNEETRAFLHWLDKTARNAFVPWKTIEHPDFPGQTVEVGGFAPFALSNPPETTLDDIAEREIAFLNTLPARLPRIELRKTTVKHLGNSVFDITVQVANSGYLPTALAQGESSREVLPIRVTLDVPASAILSGTRRVLLGPIAGSGGMREVRWVVNGAGLDGAAVRAVSDLGGSVSAQVEFDSEHP